MEDVGFRRSAGWKDGIRKLCVFCGLGNEKIPEENEWLWRHLLQGPTFLAYSKVASSPQPLCQKQHVLSNLTIIALSRLLGCSSL